MRARASMNELCAHKRGRRKRRRRSKRNALAKTQHIQLNETSQQIRAHWKFFFYSFFFSFGLRSKEIDEQNGVLSFATSVGGRKREREKKEKIYFWVQTTSSEEEKNDLCMCSQTIVLIKTKEKDDEQANVFAIIRLIRL